MTNEVNYHIGISLYHTQQLIALGITVGLVLIPIKFTFVVLFLESSMEVKFIYKGRFQKIDFVNFFGFILANNQLHTRQQISFI